MHKEIKCLFENVDHMAAVLTEGVSTTSVAEANVKYMSVKKLSVLESRLETSIDKLELVLENSKQDRKSQIEKLVEAAKSELEVVKEEKDGRKIVAPFDKIRTRKSIEKSMEKIEKRKAEYIERLRDKDLSKEDQAEYAYYIEECDEELEHYRNELKRRDDKKAVSESFLDDSIIVSDEVIEEATTHLLVLCEAYASDEVLREEVQECGKSYLKNVVASLEKNIVYVEQSLREAKSSRDELPKIEELKFVKKWMTARKGKQLDEQIKYYEEYLDYAKRLLKICKQELKDREDGRAANSKKSVKESMMDVDGDEIVIETARGIGTLLAEFAILSNPTMNSLYTVANIISYTKSLKAVLKRELALCKYTSDVKIIEKLFNVRSSKLVQVVNRMMSVGDWFIDEKEWKGRIDECKEMIKERYKEVAENDKIREDKKAAKKESKKKPVKESLIESVGEITDQTMFATMLEAFADDEWLKKNCAKMSDEELSELIPKLEKQIPMLKEAIAKEENGERPNPDDYKFIKKFMAKRQIKASENKIASLKEALDITERELAACKAEQKARKASVVKESSYIESLDDYMAESFNPEVMSDEDLSLIIEAMLHDADPADLAYFLESSIEQTLADMDSLMEAGGKNIVRLNKEAKFSQARMMAIFSIAREKRDPKFKKLVTLWRMEREIEADLIAKYGAEGTRRAKAASRKGSSSKSKTIKKVADKAKSMFNKEK